MQAVTCHRQKQTKRNVKRVHKESNIPLCLDRQQKRLKNVCGSTDGANLAAAAVSRARRTNTANNNNNDGSDFARAFGHVELLEEPQEELAQMTGNTQRRAEARKQKTGDAGGTDGDRMFANQGSAACRQMATNHDRTSRIECQQLGRELQENMNNPNLNGPPAAQQQHQGNH